LFKKALERRNNSEKNLREGGDARFIIDNRNNQNEKIGKRRREFLLIMSLRDFSFFINSIDNTK